MKEGTMFGTDPKKWTAIEGWEVSYCHPGGNCSGKFKVTTHGELAKELEWMNAEGYSYRVREIPKGGR